MAEKETKMKKLRLAKNLNSFDAYQVFVNCNAQILLPNPVKYMRRIILELDIVTSSAEAEKAEKQG